MQRPPSDSEESNSGRNREYPAGSFEAPLKTDRKPELYLERPPSLEALPKEELQDMVPEFMHRDFYRSVEGHPIAFPSQDRPLPSPPGPKLKGRSVPKRAPRFVGGRREVAFETPQTEPPLEDGFFDPYQESDEFVGLDLKETISVGLPPLPPEEKAPEPPSLRAAAPVPTSEETARKSAPLAPLRSGKTEPAPSEPSLSERAHSPRAESVPPLPSASGTPPNPESAAAPQPVATSKPSWAAPLLVALLVLSVVFVWREYERQAVVAASTVIAPSSVPQEEAVGSLGEGSPLDLEDPEGLLFEEGVSDEQRVGEGAAPDEGLAASAPMLPDGGSVEALEPSTGSSGSVSPDPADLFPETASSAPAKSAAAAPPATSEPIRGGAQDRERRLQSGNALFPDEGTAAGAGAAGLFPQVPEAASAPQPAAAPPADSGGSSLFPATMEAPPTVAPPATVVGETHTPAPAPVQEASIASPVQPLQPVEAVLPPPALPGQKPASPARPPATDTSKYHISEPSF